MINYIWVFMILTGFLYAAINGGIDSVNQAIFDGAKTGVTVSMGLISVMALWLGLMRIAEDAGLLHALANLLRPVIRFLFPSVPPGHPAEGFILSNMTANLFGLGNAATPLGIQAMKALQTLNPDRSSATPAMCTLLALNTSSLTLIPTTIIAIRMSFGSANPTEIVGTTLMATIFSTTSAILIDKFYQWRFSRTNGAKS